VVVVSPVVTRSKLFRFLFNYSKVLVCTIYCLPSEAAFWQAAERLQMMWKANRAQVANGE